MHFGLAKVSCAAWLCLGLAACGTVGDLPETIAGDLRPAEPGKISTGAEPAQSHVRVSDGEAVRRDRVPSGRVNRFGLVTVSATELEHMSATFFELGESWDAGILYRNHWPMEIIDDTCELRTDGSVPFLADALPGASLASLSYVDAGDVIVVENSEGLFAELTRRVVHDTHRQGPAYVYQGTPGGPTSASDGLTFHFPAGFFQTVRAVPVSGIEPMRLTSHGPAAALRIDDELTWNPQSDSRTYIQLHGWWRETMVTPTGVFPRNVEITCQLVDDGRFRLPEQLGRSLSSAGYAELQFTVARRMNTFVQQDDRLLLISRQSFAD